MRTGQRKANLAGAVDAPIASLFAFECRGGAPLSSVVSPQAMKSDLNYFRASWGCAIHSLVLSITLWVALVAWHDFSQVAYRLASTIWVILLIAWPAWGFILWRTSDGSIRRLLSAFATG